MPRLLPETQARLREILPEENVDVKNPVDPGAVGMFRLGDLIKVVGADPQIDWMLLLMTVDYLSNIETEENRLLAAETISGILSHLAAKVGKPIYVLVNQQRQNHEDFDRYRRVMLGKFNEKRIPWIDGSFKNAAEVFSQLVQYKHYRDSMA